MSDIKRLIKKIADEKGLTIEEVENVINIPFELQAYNMKHRCDRKNYFFPSLRVPYFLIFYSPEWLIKKFKNNNDDNQRDT